MEPFSRRIHSADVRLELVAEGRSIPLAKIGPETVFATAPVDLPPCDAQVIMSVDGRVEQWNVRLSRGADPRERTIAICDR